MAANSQPSMVFRDISTRSQPAPIIDATDEHPDVAVVQVADLQAAMQGGRGEMAVLDVRTDSEYAGGHIVGARHVCSERFMEGSGGDVLAQGILSDCAAAGAKTIVVHCMYSQCRGPMVANMLATLAKADKNPVDIALLDGGFHKFLNDTHGRGEIGDVAGLIEGVSAVKWRQTSTHGLVEADAVQSIELLTPGGSAASHVKSQLKTLKGRLSLEELVSLCNTASPDKALPMDALKTLFAMSNQNNSGTIDWHEFVDYIYSDSS